MSRKTENVAFLCAHCGEHIDPLDNGSYRNHCPVCLYSLHVDDKPGDRRSTCHGLMEPVGTDFTAAKGIQLIHQCKKCGRKQRNKIATDCNQPDDMDQILAIQRRVIFGGSR